MELPHVKTKNEFIKSINLLSAELQNAVDTQEFAESVSSIQTKLDKLAQKYQNDDKVSTEAYRLYELQALIHYFDHKDSEALNFIEYAVTQKGEMYPKAERLIAQLQQNLSPQNTTSNSKSLKGVSGWLTFFLFGVVVFILVQTYTTFDTFNSMGSLNQLSESNAEFADFLLPALWIETIGGIVLISLAVATFVLIAKRKVAGKDLAITFMVLLVILSFVDWGLVDTMARDFTEYDLEATASETASIFFRSIVYAAIWVPYFLISKRVKATLTE